MPAARTRVRTDRAGRYLDQLCRHLSQLSDHSGHGAPARVEHRDGLGVIEFASATCTLHATSDELTVTVSAADAAELRRLQRLLAARIETIGRRDNLSVIW